jgi:hypothetical protein
VRPDQPYTQQIGYAADLFYPPDKRPFNRMRVKDSIKLEGDPETYKIVSISENQVTLSNSTGKRFNIKASPSQNQMKSASK